MLRLTEQEFETFKRHNNPEVFTEQQMGAWVEAVKETLIKSEFDERNEIEKAEVDNFRSELQSFIKVEVIGKNHDPLTKGLSYQTFYTRPQQVEWVKTDIVKSIDGKDEIEKARYGTYTNTELNRKMGRVGQKFGEAGKENKADRSGKSDKVSSKEYHKNKDKPEDKADSAYANISEQNLKDYGGYIGIALESVMNSQGNNNMKNNVQAICR
jgi:hypothetical protein